MIGKSIQHDNPESLIDYMLRGEATKFVGSIDFDNLSSIETAPREMRRLASLAPSCEKAMWHIIVAWRSDEFDNAEPQESRQKEILRLTKEVVKELGLEEHQALYAVHWDAKAGREPGERHYEAHVALNRVAADGRAVSMWMDFKRLECAIAAVAGRNAKLVVPGRHNRAASERYVGANREGDAARELRDRTGSPSLKEELRGNTKLIAALTDCRAKRDAELFFQLLDAHGLGVRYAISKTGREKRNLQPGLVVFALNSPSRACAFSTLDTPALKWGQGALEALFGPEEIARQISDVQKAEALKPRKSRPDSPEYTAFRETRDEIKAANSSLRLRHRQEILEARRLLKERRATYRTVLRTGDWRVRRSSLQHWVFELVLHELFCLLHRRRIAKAEKRIEMLDVAFRAELREAPTWTSWQRAAAAKKAREERTLTPFVELENQSIAAAATAPSEEEIADEAPTTPVELLVQSPAEAPFVSTNSVPSVPAASTEPALRQSAIVGQSPQEPRQSMSDQDADRLPETPLEKLLGHINRNKEALEEMPTRRSVNQNVVAGAPIPERRIAPAAPEKKTPGKDRINRLLEQKTSPETDISNSAPSLQATPESRVTSELHVLPSNSVSSTPPMKTANPTGPAAPPSVGKTAPRPAAAATAAKATATTSQLPDHVRVNANRPANGANILEGANSSTLANSTAPVAKMSKTGTFDKLEQGRATAPPNGRTARDQSSAAPKKEALPAPGSRGAKLTQIDASITAKAHGSVESPVADKQLPDVINAMPAKRRYFISYDVPIPFRSALTPAARHELQFSDWLKELASKVSKREMSALAQERFNEVRLQGPSAKEALTQVENIQRVISMAYNEDILRAGLRARAFHIDAKHVEVVRSPNRLADEAPNRKKPSVADLSDILRDREVLIADDRIVISATKMDILDAKAIVAGARNASERPGGLKTTRTAFFIATHHQALIPEKLRSDLNARRPDEVIDVSFDLGAFAQTKLRAIDPAAWTTNFVLVSAESRTKATRRTRMPDRGRGLE